MSDIRISDHALVRYIERVRGESLDGYRAEMAGVIERHTGSLVPEGGFDDGFVFVLEGNVAVTVLPSAFRPKKARGRCKFQTLVHVPAPEKPWTFRAALLRWFAAADRRVR